jgi:hypothetical protein
VVAGVEKGLSVVSLDGMFDHGNQPMGWNSYNTWKFQRIDTTAHPHFCYANRTLASRRAMGSCADNGIPMGMGMGIVIYGFDQLTAENAIKLDHSAAFGLACRSLLGALVGSQTQKFINGGVEVW